MSCYCFATLPIVNILVRDGEKHFFEEICDGVLCETAKTVGLNLLLNNLLFENKHVCLSEAPGGGGVGGTPYNGLYGEAPPEKGTFFRLQVHFKSDFRG